MKQIYAKTMCLVSWVNDEGGNRCAFYQIGDSVPMRIKEEYPVSVFNVLAYEINEKSGLPHP